MRPILDWASIAQGLMRALLVVPLHPVPDDASCLVKRLERLLPDALFFETAEEPFDDPILFRRIRCDELLRQPIIPTGLAKPPTLEDEAVVAPQDWRSYRPQRPKPGETGRFDRPFRLFCATPQGELVADHLPIVTVDHRREMRPAVLAAGNMRHVHGPPFVTATGPTDPALYTRTWGGHALVHEPPLLFQHTIDRFTVHDHPALISQQHLQAAVPERGMLLDQLVKPFGPGRIGPPASPLRCGRSMQARSADAEHLTASSFRDTRHARSHASDVFRSKG